MVPEWYQNGTRMVPEYQVIKGLYKSYRLGCGRHAPLGSKSTFFRQKYVFSSKITFFHQKSRFFIKNNNFSLKLYQILARSIREQQTHAKTIGFIGSAETSDLHSAATATFISPMSIKPMKY